MDYLARKTLPTHTHKCVIYFKDKKRNYVMNADQVSQSLYSSSDTTDEKTAGATYIALHLDNGNKVCTSLF